MTWRGTVLKYSCPLDSKYPFHWHLLFALQNILPYSSCKTHAHSLQNKGTGNPTYPATWGDTKADVQINVNNYCIFVRTKHILRAKCICLGSIQVQLTASNCGQWRRPTSLFSVTWMDTRLQNYALSSKIEVKSTRKAAWIVWQIASEIYVRKSK